MPGKLALIDLSDISRLNAPGANVEATTSGWLHPVQHRFLRNLPPNANHYNISILLRIDQTVSRDALDLAVAMVFKRHDIFGYRFTTGCPQATIAPEKVVLEVRQLSTPDCDTQALDSLCDEIQKSLDISTGPTSRAVYIETPHASDYLLFVFHHLVADAISGRVLLQELHSLYRAALAGAVPAGESTADRYSDYARLLWETANDPDGTDLTWWRSQPWEKLSFIAPDRPSGSLHMKHCTPFVTWLGEAETTEFSRIRRSHGISSEELLIAAVGSAAADRSRSAVVGIDVLRHGRVPLRSSQNVMRTIGWIGAFAPHLLDFGPANDLASIARQVRQFRAREASWGALTYLHDDPDVRSTMAGLPRSQIQINYRGNALDVSRIVSPPFSWVSEHNSISLTPDRNQSHEIKVYADVVGRRLRISWLYSTERLDRRTVADVATGTIDRIGVLLGTPSNAGSPVSVSADD